MTLMNKTLSWLTVAAPVAALGLGAYWYVWPTKADQYAVHQRPLSQAVTGPGLLGASRQVVVTARIQGFLSEVTVERNDVVAKGQVLARLDAPELLHQHAAAVANQRAAAEAVREAEIERDRLGIAIRQLTANIERQTQLLQQRSVSQAVFDAADSELRQAKANQARANAAIARALATAQAAAADVLQLAARLRETTIVSPIDGVVISRSRTAGDLLAPGAELVQIVDPTAIVVFARFDESAMWAFRPGQSASLRFSSSNSQSFSGSVLRVIRQVDQETREFTAEITLDALPEQWAIGQRCLVTVQAGSAEPRLAVPQRYIARHDGRAGVWVNRGGRAEWAHVSVGADAGAEVEVTKGLAAGDVIVDPRGRYRFEPVSGAPAT